VIQIKQAVAEHARREASYRTRRGLEGNAIAGKPTGGRAFGYVAARDGASGQIGIDAQQSAIVCRIFEMYANGTAPRAIAATLNQEGIPSPGATWNRTERRRDRKWLASAIHGDVNRGTGILNNRRYIGVVVWGRSEWKRSAADSQKRRHRMLEKGVAHESVDERLRIVPQELWDRVKGRQQQRSHGIGALVRGGLRQRKPGAGRPGKYVFSGLLACGVCGASFVLRNREYYACASWWNGAACANSLNVSRKLVEEVLLTGIREDLRDPAIIEEVKRRANVVARQAEKPRTDLRQKIGDLEKEVENLTDAIAGGLLRSSPALAQRLAKAEDELARMKAARTPKAPATLMPDLEKRWLEMVTKLETALAKDPERARENLRGLFGGRIEITPDESNRFLWADYDLTRAALLSPADLMVAGGRYELYSIYPLMIQVVAASVTTPA
jgi:site-specific DNA recombinase